MQMKILAAIMSCVLVFYMQGTTTNALLTQIKISIEYKKGEVNLPSKLSLVFSLF